ncbi:MAG: hypothetical protein ABIR71_09545 [Chthoniobacterales bacterium]
MQLNPAILRQRSMFPQNLPRHAGSPQASAEIHAYIAARDLALATAERNTSDLTLNRAFLANQLVGDCLKPARAPYQAQSLSEAEAMRERQRTELVGKRIAQLRTVATTQRFGCAVAA